jgi:diguanylate cyclase (GGDEF)-like protein
MSANLVATLFIVVILISLYEVPREALKATRLFRICMWITFLGLIVEMAIFTLEGKANYSGLLTLLNFLALAMVDAITIVYSYYCNYLVEESARKYTSIQAYIITAICSLEIVFYIIGVITGKLFTVENGYIMSGPWDPFKGAASAVCFLAMCVLYAFKYRSFRIRSRLFVVLIVAVPMGAMLIHYLDPNSRFYFLGASVSMNVIYVIIESKIIAEAVANAKMYNEISEKDMLTGLKNRRGYQTVLDSCYEDEKVGIAFADVNSLKYVNDNEGHEAGDNLIKSVATILTDAAPDAIACRISGDEFVCIVRHAETDAFAHTMKQLESVLAKNGRIAAFGYDIGAGRNVYETIKNAEQMMYADKERYYKETGKDRRR